MVEQIAERTGLRLSTVEQGLKFVKQLPLVETRVNYEMTKRSCGMELLLFRIERDPLSVIGGPAGI